MTTVANIKILTGRILTADADSGNAKVEYLRLLVGDVQTALGAAVARKRAGKPAKLTAEERTQHLNTLTSTNERFYTAVLETARESVPPGADRGKRLNAAVNWARTSLRDVRNYIRAGNDVRALNTAKLTRAQLRVESTPRPASVGTLRKRLVERGKDMIAAALAVIDADPVAARTEVELIMSQMATQLLNLSGGKTTRDADEAASQHRPFRVKSTVFIPTETMVARQIEQPS